MILSPLGIKLKNNSDLCCFHDGSWFTYKDLYSLAVYYSTLIRPRTVSFVIGSNSLHVIAFYLACLSCNSPVVLLPNTLSTFVLERYLLDFRPRQLFNLESNLLNSCHYKPHDDYLTLYHDAPTLDQHYDLPALLLPTSGSTGARKLVKVSFDNLRSNTNSIIEYLGITSLSRHICSLPFSYTYGLSCINTHLSVGASLILNDFSVIDSCFWALVSNLQPTTISGVPYTYQTLARFNRDRLISLPFTQYTQAGGKLSSKLVRYFHGIASDSNAEFIVMYGQTEATARMSYLPFDSLPAKVGSIGVPIPSGSFTIDVINQLPHINSYPCGELVYSGPNVTHGYSTSLTNLYIVSPAPKFLRTGDLAYKDSDGFYFITGRISRFAKIDGIRVSLDDLESQSGLSDIACISDDNHVYVFHISTLDPGEVLASLKSRSSLPSRVFRLVPLESIPRNDSGKIDYPNLNSRISK